MRHVSAPFDTNQFVLTLITNYSLYLFCYPFLPFSGSVCVSVRSLSVFVCLSFSGRLYVYLSVPCLCLFVCLSLVECLCVCPFLVCVCLSVCLSKCMTVLFMSQSQPSIKISFLFDSNTVSSKLLAL